MLRGFMDHWVPTVDSISTFWKSDISACKDLIDGLASEVAFNNFTFYTKWYTNGISSELQFLRNHPDSSNVRTDNHWGRELIDHLHSRGMTAGAMLQLYTYEKGLWADMPSLGEWDVRGCAATDAPCVLADFTSDAYPSKLAQILREHLILFPDLDYLFLEFEGIMPEMAVKAYENHAAKVGGLPDPVDVTYREQDIALYKSIGNTIDLRYSVEALDLFTYYMRRNLETAQGVCDELEYRGRLGVVYYPPQYESLFVPNALPGNRWRLLPWCYFGWTPDPQQKAATMKMMLHHMEEQLAAGRRVLYIGDAAISPWDTESIETTLQFCESHLMEGYLGMGNPVDHTGLRWTDVTTEQVQKVRDIFAKAWK